MQKRNIEHFVSWMKSRQCFIHGTEQNSHFCAYFWGLVEAHTTSSFRYRSSCQNVQSLKINTVQNYKECRFLRLDANNGATFERHFTSLRVTNRSGFGSVEDTCLFNQMLLFWCGHDSYVLQIAENKEYIPFHFKGPARPIQEKTLIIKLKNMVNWWRTHFWLVLKVWAVWS